MTTRPPDTYRMVHVSLGDAIMALAGLALIVGACRQATVTDEPYDEPRKLAVVKDPPAEVSD